MKFQSLGDREISAHDLDLRRQIGRIGIAYQRANLRAGVRQLRSNLAADGSGGANEKTAHTELMRIYPPRLRIFGIVAAEFELCIRSNR